MFSSKAGSAVLLCALLLVTGVAESVQHDTATQHHEWSRKFEPADPDVTGSISPRDKEVTVDLRNDQCQLNGLTFGRVPIKGWRIDTC
jgi:hypothetical protein